MTITIEGRDDAEVLVDHGDGDRERRNAYNGITFVCHTQRERLQISLAVEPLSGCWHATIGQTDEASPVPEWPLRITQGSRDYSVRVELDAPNDAELVEVGA